jgi:hypothetical protein
VARVLRVLDVDDELPIVSTVAEGREVLGLDE